MLLDNPFLIREIRQLERRPASVQNSLLICLGLMALTLVGCTLLLSQAQSRLANPSIGSLIDAGMWVLGVLHVLLCSIVAGYGGYRIFALENSRSTFESLQLLPYSPGRWIWLKLSFPILSTLIVWAAGLPLFILAALCTLIRMEDIPRLMQKPLLAAAAILLIALLITPDMISKHREMMARQQKGIKQADREYAIWNSLIVGIGYVALMESLVGQPVTNRELAWFSWWFPESWFWLTGIGCILPAAIVTATTALVVSRQVRIVAWYLRLLALGVLYVICLGFLWPYLSQWFRLGAVFFPALMWLMTREKPAERPENLGNEAYVQRIAGLWDNPLLVRDLRVMGRHMPVGRYFLGSLAAVTLGPLVVYVSFNYLGRPVFLQSLIWGCFWGIIQIIPSTWSNLRIRWQKEWSGQTMPQLLITPLTDREIVLGRMAAVPAFHWVGLLPFAPAILVLLGWLSWKGFWICGPLVLALCPLLLSMGAWMSTGIVREKRPPSTLTLRDIPMALLIVGQGLVLTGCLQLAYTNLNTTTTNSDWGKNPVLAWAAGIGMFILNAALCWGWFQFRVWQVHQFRSGDIDIPDSTILKQETKKAPKGFRWRNPCNAFEGQDRG